MFHVYIGHSPPGKIFLHLVFKPINNNVLIIIHLYCNVLILIYKKNHPNIAGRLSLHKLKHTLHLKNINKNLKSSN